MITRAKILNSIEPVLADSIEVTINTDRVKEVAEELISAEVPKWNNDLQFLGTPEETAQYYFFIDSINFCFWGLKGQQRWEYEVDGKWIAGYYAYSRAVKDAFLRDGRFFDATYLSEIPEQNFKSIFAAGRSTLLLVNERLNIIRENFRILKNQFGGQAINLLRQADMDADNIVSLLLKNFPTFDDSVEWNGRQVFFLKRAQIFTSDLSFIGLPELEIKNLGHLTVFADYKLPQILESFGVLKYSPELDSDIINEKLIQTNSRKEIELRANSIAAIEQIRSEMEKIGRKISTNELDWILWVKAKETVFKKPHHKTLTIFY